jgi:hypothetical protein
MSVPAATKLWASWATEDPIAPSFSPRPRTKPRARRPVPRFFSRTASQERSFEGSATARPSATAGSITRWSVTTCPGRSPTTLTFDPGGTGSLKASSPGTGIFPFAKAGASTLGTGPSRSLPSRATGRPRFQTLFTEQFSSESTAARSAILPGATAPRFFPSEVLRRVRVTIRSAARGEMPDFTARRIFSSMCPPVAEVAGGKVVAHHQAPGSTGPRFPAPGRPVPPGCAPWPLPGS